MTFKELLADELGDKLNMWDVIDDAAIDSLEYFAFIVRLENEFGVKLKDADVAKARTFYDLECLATGCEPATPC